MNDTLPAPDTRRGLFIMIEGTDGSGKTTQTELLVAKLQQGGYPVEQISFPQYGQSSAAMVEEYLRGAFGSAEEVGPYRASIFYAVDRYVASPTIRQWLAEGKVVIANRYVASNMGHQGGKIKNATERQAYYNWNYHLEYEIFQIPKPDINIILHVPATLSQQLVDQKGEREYLKGKKRDIHEDDLKHLADAEEAYLEIARLYPEFTVLECTTSGAMLPIAEVHEQIYSIVCKTL